MCVTCGCSDGVGVRITDPATGESTTLDSGAGSGIHEHTDAAGRRYRHIHVNSLTAPPSTTLPAGPSPERHDA